MLSHLKTKVVERCSPSSERANIFLLKRKLDITKLISCMLHFEPTSRSKMKMEGAFLWIHQWGSQPSIQGVLILTKGEMLEEVLKLEEPLFDEIAKGIQTPLTFPGLRH